MEKGKFENAWNPSFRSFMLGSNMVKEHLNYNFVKVRAYSFEDDVSGLEEYLSKARQALNTISSLGIM